MADATIKICYIGGGSRYWAQELMAGLARCPRINGELVLYDIDQTAAQRNVPVADAFFAHPDAQTSFRTRAAAELGEALDGADFVVSSIEPGPVSCRYADLEIPLKYGLLQSVGDTTGPGGLLRAMRAVSTHTEFARAVMRHCPAAWVINYTNPMTLCTAAFYAAEPAVKAFGCCHEVFGTQRMLARWVQEWFELDEAPDRHEIVLDIAGVNHFTLAAGASWRGDDLFPRLRERAANPLFMASQAADAEARKARQSFFEGTGRIACDLLRRFGVLGAAGDRHLAEFVPWYLTSEDNLHRWGVTLTPYAWRKKDSERLPPTPDEIAARPLKAPDEEAVPLILALLGLAPLQTNVNLPNRGQMPGYTDGAVVETYARFDKDSVRPLPAAPLPQPIAGHLRRVIAVQQTALQACLARSKSLALQALFLDPLVHLPSDRVAEMFDEMCAFCADYLPGWQ